MDYRGKILIIDDDLNFCKLLSSLLSNNDYEARYVNEPAQSINILEDEQFDLVLLDLKLGKIDGIEILQNIRKIDMQTPVIMLTNFSSTEYAVKAIKAGAYDYLLKEVKEEELLIKIKNAIAKSKDSIKLNNVGTVLAEEFSLDNIIGRNEKMKKIHELIEDVSKTDVLALILGETGTGKELIARAIHFKSPRRNAAFVDINCAAISEHLMESEIFGHEKGAFTGAIKLKQGKVELANEGTLFLDEIGDMNIELQSRLLRFLENKAFERVGGTRKLVSNARIIAATNMDLKTLADKERFRKDLYYRLNKVQIELPPLRERKDDIGLLAEYFINKSNKRFGKSVKGISKEGSQLLCSYDWPGNVRELENLIERIILTIQNDVISAEDVRGYLKIQEVPEKIKEDIDTSLGLNELKAKLEKDYINNMLKKYQGNVRLVAEKAKVSQKTIYAKMKEYRITNEDFSLGLKNPT